MEDVLAGKTLLVTGGTGSFGHEFVRHVLRKDGFRQVRIFSRDELKQEMMRAEIADSRVSFIIGDVRDPVSVDAAMRGVDYVFHAAALKQVPSCEFFPMEAVKTNILGSNVVLEAAIANQVSKVVCLSTDKAVYPINAMGMTKALMEKTVRAQARRLPSGSATRISCVRYGNIMCTRGSVIPLFIEQIKRGDPVTVTDPSMTRFLLPLSQALDLVLFALSDANQGDLLVRKAPACTVGDLATVLQEILGRSVGVRTIGIRHGEKIHETLVTREEMQTAEDLGDYLRCVMDTRDLNYTKYIQKGFVSGGATTEFTSENARQLDRAELKELLASLPQIQEKPGLR